MTNEEIQRVMEYLVKRQEAFAGSMDKMEARMSQLESTVRDLSGVVNETAKAQKELVEAQRQTDERLNALINTVERYINERRNRPPD